jgi:hypothetical protein
VISGHEKYRNPALGDPYQRFESAGDDRRMNTAAEKQVPAVNHQIDLALQGRRQGHVEIFEKVDTAPAPVNSRLHRQIESEMGIRQKKDVDLSAIGRHILRT